MIKITHIFFKFQVPGLGPLAEHWKQLSRSIKSKQAIEYRALECRTSFNNSLQCLFVSIGCGIGKPYLSNALLF